MVHKGLDLVLEAFVAMPEYHLTVCGKVSSEKDFEDAYAFSAAIKAAATNADFFRIAEEFWQKRGLKLPPSPYEGLI